MHRLFFGLILFMLGLTVMGQDVPLRKPLILPAYSEFIAPNPRFVVGQLMPLGFSADGKFAYVVEPPDEACGCYFFEFHIRDLDTDKDLFMKRVEYEDSSAIQWDRAWKEYGALFFGQLKSHGIHLTALNAETFPISVGNEVLNVRSATALRPLYDDASETVIDHAQIYLRNVAGQEKRISKLRYPLKQVLSLDAGLYLRSPYEDRVAIVLILTARGWEGPPSPIHFEVIGALTKKGFR
jgi:hypothetical protein